MMSSRLAYVDALRGFAILGVIIAHAGSIAGLDGRFGMLAGFAGMGVQLFFVISAFTIFLTFARASSSESRPVGNFFIRRLFRIVPIYWAGILLYTFIYGLESRGWRPGPELWHYMLHLTLTNVLHPETSSSVVPGGWSISVEVLFYFTMPIWFLLVSGVRSAALFTVTATFVAMAGIPIIRTIIDPALAYDNLDEYWTRSFLSQLPCFGFGFILYFLTVNPSNPLRLLGRPIPNACVLAAAPIAFVAGYKLALPLHYVVSLASLMVGAALSQMPWRILVNQITTFVGRVSYSAYLLHFLVLQKLSEHTHSLGTLPRFLILLALGTAITIPLAYLSYRAVEIPCTSLAKRLILKRERQATHRKLVSA